MSFPVFPFAKRWPPRRWHVWRWACWFALLTVAQAQTDPLFINRVKAGFVFKFAQFTQWPAEQLSPHEPLRIGVLAKAEVVAAIRETLAEKTITGHSIEVIAPTTEGDWQSLHILYVTSSSPLTGPELNHRIRQPGLLTVGDAPDFAQRSGVLAFFERDGKLRFRINPSTAKDRGVQISHKLASLGEVVSP